MKKEKTLLRNFLEIFIPATAILAIVSSFILVYITNTGGEVSKYFSYSFKVVSDQDSIGRLSENDLIVTKEKESYQAKDYIWYFVSENETKLGEVKEIILKDNKIKYSIISEEDYVYDDNVIGKIEYRIPNIGKPIRVLKNR